MRFSTLLTIGSILLTACSTPTPSEDAGILTTNGFEQSIGWGNADAASLTTEKANTGHWSIRVKPDVPFSYTYARTLGDLQAAPIHKLELVAWALRVSAGSKAKLVIQVDSSATNEHKVIYEALALDQAVPAFGKWTEVHLPVTLPAAAQKGNLLKVYLWNDNSTAPTYVDDIKLRVLD